MLIKRNPLTRCLMSIGIISCQYVPISATRWRSGLDPRWPGSQRLRMQCKWPHGPPGGAPPPQLCLPHFLHSVLFFPLQVYTVLPACTDLGTEPGTGSSGARGSAWQPWDAGTGDAEGDPSLPPRSSSVVSRPRLAAAPQPPWCVHTWPTPVLVPSQRPCLPNKPPHLDGERFKTSKI